WAVSPDLPGYLVRYWGHPYLLGIPWMPPLHFQEARGTGFPTGTWIPASLKSWRTARVSSSSSRHGTIGLPGIAAGIALALRSAGARVVEAAPPERLGRTGAARREAAIAPASQG